MLPLVFFFSFLVFLHYFFVVFLFLPGFLWVCSSFWSRVPWCSFLGFLWVCSRFLLGDPQGTPSLGPPPLMDCITFAKWAWHEAWLGLKNRQDGHVTAGLTKTNTPPQLVGYPLVWHAGH